MRGLSTPRAPFTVDLPKYLAGIFGERKP